MIALLFGGSLTKQWLPGLPTQISDSGRSLYKQDSVGTQHGKLAAEGPTVKLNTPHTAGRCSRFASAPIVKSRHQHTIKAVYKMNGSNLGGVCRPRKPFAIGGGALSDQLSSRWDAGAPCSAPGLRLYNVRGLVSWTEPRAKRGELLGSRRETVDGSESFK